MGIMKRIAEDFLHDKGGYDLGYDWGSLPELEDFDEVVEKQIDAQEYF